MIPLVCPKCGGPLPASAATAEQTKCAFCSVVLCRVAHDFEPATGSVPTAPSDRVRQGRQAFEAAIQKGFQAGDDPRAVLKHALSEHLGLESEAEVVATVAFGLAEQLQRDEGVDLKTDAVAICRLALAYINAADVLRESQQAELNLPFITATSSGPVHYSRSLTIADIRTLASGRPLTQEQPPPATATDSTDPPTKKKWWWPF